jgi:hypothetical protein
MSEYDGRYFAWVRQTSAWIEPKLYPQIIFDTKMADYLINHQNNQARLDIVRAYVLTLDEYDLTLDELIKMYPAPEMTNGSTD